MISAIILFLLTAIALTIYTMYSFWWLVTLILLILLGMISIKAVHEAHSFGYRSLFRAFHKYPNANEQLNLVEFILTRGKEKNTVFRFQEDILICLARSGVYLIKVLDYVGRISGNIEDTRFQLNGGKLASYIPNFFFELDQLEEILKNNIARLHIQKLIIKKGTCVIQIPHSRDYQITEEHSLYYTFQKMNKEKFYTAEEIKKLQFDLNEYLSKCVNLE